MDILPHEKKRKETEKWEAGESIHMKESVEEQEKELGVRILGTLVHENLCQNRCIYLKIS